MLTKTDLLDLGFVTFNQFTIGGVCTYDLGRDRELSISCVGTPNEVCFLCQLDKDHTPTQIEDLVCVHNYDYDGYITKEKILGLIRSITLGDGWLVTNYHTTSETIKSPFIDGKWYEIGFLSDINGNFTHQGIHMYKNGFTDHQGYALKPFPTHYREIQLTTVTPKE